MPIEMRGRNRVWRSGIGVLVSSAGLLELQSDQGLLVLVSGLLAAVLGADLAVAGVFACDPLYARAHRTGSLGDD